MEPRLPASVEQDPLATLLSHAAQIEKLPPELQAQAMTVILRQVETADEKRRSEISIAERDAEHNRNMRKMSLLLGTLMGLAAIGLGFHAVSNGSNLFGIAAMMAPIAALAGVFVWGPRTRDETPPARPKETPPDRAS